MLAARSLALTFTVAVGAGVAGADRVPSGVAAPTETIRFQNWVERSPNGYGWRAMTFRVQSVTVTRRGWSVRAVVVNRTRQTIRIRSQASAPFALSRQHDFGLAEPGPPCDPQPYKKPCGYLYRSAAVFRPRPYGRNLRPGQSWSGTFSGYGPLRKGVPHYVWFGPFVPERGAPFSWLTERSFRLR